MNTILLQSFTPMQIMRTLKRSLYCLVIIALLTGVQTAYSQQNFRSYLNPATVGTALGTFNSGGNATLNLTTMVLTEGANTYSGTLYTHPVNGQNYILFVFDAFTLGAGHTLGYTGSTNAVGLTGTAGVIILSRNDLTVSGTIDFNATGTTGGPGATNGVNGNANYPSTFGPGGPICQDAGGGFGGKGGHCSGTYGGLDFILTGGSGGGATSGNGGGGGGGIQLGANGTLTVSGTINANGASGVGGGSGGGILLYGQNLTLTSAILNARGANATNWGGGGGGRILYTAIGGTATGTPTINVSAGSNVGNVSAPAIGTNGAIPTITDITPASGPVGSSVRLTGTNLGSINAVRFFGSSGTLATVLSSNATTILVAVPSGATGTGQIYVENFFGNASRNFTVNVVPATITSFASNAVRVLGQTGYGVGNTSAGTARNRLNVPHGIAVHGPTGKVFVAEHVNHRVLRYSSFSALTDGADAEVVFGQSAFNANSTASVTDNFNTPEGIYVDGVGNLWIADVLNHRVLRYDDAVLIFNGQTRRANEANFVMGQADFTTNSNGTTQTKFKNPVDVFVDESSGTLWVADANNHRVLRFDNIYTKTSGLINADGVLGQANYDAGAVNRELTPSTLGMNFPTGVFVDNTGRLYVADFSGNRVLWFNNARTKLNSSNAADGVIGQVSGTQVSANRGGAVAANTLNKPNKVRGDAAGNIWVTDKENHRVLRYTNPAGQGDGPNATTVLGQTSYTVNASGNTSEQFADPVAVALDAQGRVYVGEVTNNRLTIFDALTLTATSRTPTSAAPGMPITITGTALNVGVSASVGGTAMTIASSSATQLVVNLPSNVSVGNQTITLTSSLGSTTVTVTVVSNAGGSALQFNGTSTVVNYGTNFNPNGAFTFEAWVRPTTGGTIVSQWRFGSGSALYYLSLGNDGGLGLSPNNGSFISAPAGSVPMNQWSHVAFTISGNNVQIFVNGQLRGSGSQPFAGTSSLDILLGGLRNNEGGITSYFTGQMDEVRFYNAVISQTQIQDNMLRDASSANNMSGYFKLNEGNGTTALPSAGNVNGTITGGAYIVSEIPFGSSTVIPTFATNLRGHFQGSNVATSGNVTLTAGTTITNSARLYVGHNGSDYTYQSTDVPSGVSNRLARVWRAEATTDPAPPTVTISFDVSSLPGVTSTGLRLLQSNSTAFAGISGGQIVTGTLTGTTVTFTGITLANGGYFTLGDAPALPVISSINPTSAQRGETVTISGASLSNATAVRFFGSGGQTATIQSNTATQIVATVPNTTGNGGIFVQTTLGTANSATFTQPVVQTVPSSAVAGQSATIGGLNLDLVTAVTVNGASAAMSNQTRTSLTITVPSSTVSGSAVLSLTGTGGTGTGTLTVIGTPTVTGVSQTSAGAGSTITLTGTNLNQITSVNFFGASGTPATVVSSSATSLVVTVPANPSANQGQIFVSNAAGNALSPTFTVILPPTITGISSLVTTTGQTLTLTGTNMGNITAVRFFGTAGTVGVIQQQSLTQVVVTVPAGIAGSVGNIAITNIAGTVLSNDAVTIVSPPTITAQSAREIVGGGSITLTGTNLDRVTSVQFFGVNGGVGTVVSQTPTQLIARAPSLFTQRSGRIVVQNIAGSASSPQDINAIVQPVITSVGPLPTYAGQPLTITGTNFTGVSAVRFFGVDGVTASIVSLTDTQINIAVPRTSLQLGEIIVTNIAGIASSQRITLLQPPQIATVPASASVGDTITITGFNFELLRAVRFFGATGVQGTIISSTPTQIRVRIPVQNLTSASGQITVENAVGIGTASDVTRLFAPPLISAVTVDGVVRTLVREGETVTAVGDNLDQVQAVRVFGVNGTPIPFTNARATSLQFVIPSGLYGQSGQIALVNPVGTGLTPTLTVGRAPTITGVQPTLFSAGDTVVIAGQDLQFVSSVRFYGSTGTAGRILSQTGTSMFVIVPAGTGQGRVYAENVLGNTLSPQTVAYRITVPIQPRSLAISAITTSAATLTFAAPTTGGVPVTFEVRLTPTGTIAPSIVRFVEGTSSYTVQFSNLGSGTRYTAEVRSVNGGGASAYASVGFETGLSGGAPNVPTALRVEQAGQTTARIAWTPAGAGGTPSRYRVQWRWVVTPAVNGANPSTRDLTEQTVDRFSNVMDFANMNYTQLVNVPIRFGFITFQQPRLVPVVYQFRVRSENAAFQSAYSDWITLSAPPNIPGAPINVTAQDITSTTFLAQGNVTGDQLQSVTFNLFSSDNNFTQPIQTLTQVRTGSGQVRQFFSGIRDGVEYIVEITARNLGGTSPAGRSARFRALPNTPGAPQLLTATNLRVTSFDANWVILRGLGGTPDGFEVQLASGEQPIDSGRVTQVVGSATVRTTLTGLNPELPYRWRLRAYNNNRTAFSAWSDIVSVNLIDFRRRDSLALVRIFREGGGTSWTNTRNWNTTVSIDLWYGVVTEGGRVISLELGNNRLTALSPAVGQLSALRFLSVWGNSLTSLPDSIALLRNLEEIEAHNNQMTAFNVNLSGLNALTVLRLNGNRISSLGANVFPASSPLRVVRLDNNSFSGSFTQQIFNLNEVRIVNLANNNLTALAGNVAKWLNLSHISLNRNSLTSVPNLTNNFSIRHYNVAQNRLSANSLSVNSGLNIPRVTYITDPQSLAVVAGQSAPQENDMGDIPTTPNPMSIDVLSGILTANTGVRVYPIPARDELMIDIAPLQSGTARIIITDNLGRVVQEQRIAVTAKTVSTFKFDVSMLTAGHYTIALATDMTVQQPIRTSFVIVR
jgi:sugar lactone lactonase YvrE